MKPYLLLALLVLPGRSWADGAAPDSAVDSHWSYSSKGGVARTTRRSLLVANPGTRDERQFHVVSTCEKQAQSEATYGKCTHRIRLVPGDKTLTLDTGEDVFLAYGGGVLPTTRPLLATVRYGCCGGPGVVS